MFLIASLMSIERVPSALIGHNSPVRITAFGQDFWTEGTIGMLNGSALSPHAQITKSILFPVPEAVKQAMLVYLCSQVEGRAISTADAIGSMRRDAPECTLTDKQLELYAVTQAVEQDYAIRFDCNAAEKTRIELAESLSPKAAYDDKIGYATRAA
ncbi:hypothetical protein ABFT80_16950 [Mesorhizobium sp. SB112]|uniref:hypothetical protein n=1 Tax=Mesorhizobium sp. SB112 TaxID=3151853 RepID=UPI003263C6F8